VIAHPSMLRTLCDLSKLVHCVIGSLRWVPVYSKAVVKRIKEGRLPSRAFRLDSMGSSHTPSWTASTSLEIPDNVLDRQVQ
jgi:hypothetical protein